MGFAKRNIDPERINLRYTGRTVVLSLSPFPVILKDINVFRYAACLITRMLIRYYCGIFFNILYAV